MAAKLLVIVATLAVLGLIVYVFIASNRAFNRPKAGRATPPANGAAVPTLDDLFKSAAATATAPGVVAKSVTNTQEFTDLQRIQDVRPLRGPVCDSLFGPAPCTQFDAQLSHLFALLASGKTLDIDGCINAGKIDPRVWNMVVNAVDPLTGETVRSLLARRCTDRAVWTRIQRSLDAPQPLDPDTANQVGA